MKEIPEWEKEFDEKFTRTWKDNPTDNHYFTQFNGSREEIKQFISQVHQSAYEQGVKEERERIIKLMWESQDEVINDKEHGFYNDPVWRGSSIDLTIRLYGKITKPNLISAIKGEV